MKFIILERHDAPVFSGYIYVNVGGVDEPVGNTGIAHVFEHMAFKGTTTLGTKNYQAEKAVMDEMDAVYDQLRSEWVKADRADPERVKQLQAEFDALQENVSQYSDGEEYSKLLEQEGAVGINATTSADSTEYFYSLPSNRLELWMALESSRFLDPVMREFFKEKDVIKEERRGRVGSSPIGRLLEEMNGLAFLAHPYGRPIIGHMSDINTTTRAEALAFFEQFYAPSNMVAAIVGDVQTDQVIQMAEKILRQNSVPRQPAPCRNHRAETVGYAACQTHGAIATHFHLRLPCSIHQASRFCRTGSNRGHSVLRTHVTFSQEADSRRESLNLRRRVSGVSGRQIRQPFRCLLIPGARAFKREE